MYILCRRCLHELRKDDWTITSSEKTICSNCLSRVDERVEVFVPLACKEPRVCGVTFNRLADDQLVLCCGTQGHWPETAHQF